MTSRRAEKTGLLVPSYHSAAVDAQSADMNDFNDCSVPRLHHPEQAWPDSYLIFPWVSCAPSTGQNEGLTHLRVLSAAQPAQVQTPSTDQPSGTQAAVPGKDITGGLGKCRPHLCPSWISILAPQQSSSPSCSGNGDSSSWVPRKELELKVPRDQKNLIEVMSPGCPQLRRLQPTSVCP